jgi:uncharacterized protein (DUF1684 family)
MRELAKTIFLLLCISGCKVITDEYSDNVMEHRKNIDELFADEKTSPLTPGDRAKFKGVEYFDIDKNYSVDARIVKFDSTQIVEIQHTLNRKYPFIRWGMAHFKLMNDSCHLTIYKAGGRDEGEAKNTMLFIPFKDASNGVETYSGGRYLDIETPKGSITNIDFNLSYNPNCAYSDTWSCPLVPAENILQQVVRAGAKKFERGHL